MTPGSPAVQLGSTRRELPLPPGAPFYRHLWRAWRRLGRALGMLISRVVTTIVYFVVITPFALSVRWSSDPLELRSGPAHWTSLPAPGGIDEARLGF